jgi:pentatricopeptide repeat protein
MRCYAVETIANPRTGSVVPGVPRIEQTSPQEENDVPDERLHSGAELFGPKGLDTPQNLEDVDVSKSQHTKRLNKAVNAHLDRMNDDPYTIGKYVERALARGAFEEAHLLVVKATSRMDHQLTVSWNALIDHMLKKDRIKDAIKIYNDVSGDPDPDLAKSANSFMSNLGRADEKAPAIPK